MNNYYLDIPQKVNECIKEQLEELNYDLSFVTRTSNLPEDDYLYIVIAVKRNPYNENYPLTLFQYNDSSHSLFWGCYDINMETAFKLLAEKVEEKLAPPREKPVEVLQKNRMTELYLPTVNELMQRLRKISDAGRGHEEISICGARSLYIYEWLKGGITLDNSELDEYYDEENLEEQ